MKLVIYCIVIVGTMGGLAQAGMDPTCFKLPGNKDPKQCCNVPTLVSEDIFTKCMSDNPMPSMPPPADKMRGCVSLNLMIHKCLIPQLGSFNFFVNSLIVHI
jgi:hypothetical protein